MKSPFKLRADRVALAKAVTVASAIISRRSTIPILSYVKLEVDGGSVVLTGTGLDMEIRVEIEADGHGATCLPALRLRDTLKAMSNAATASLVGDDKGNVKLTADGVEAVFLSLPAVDHPTIKIGSEAWRLTLPDGVTGFLVGGAASVMSTEETRYYLNGVCFEVKEGSARATATDGHRLISRSTKLDGEPPEVGEIIIHRDAVKALVPLVGKKDATLVGHVGQGKNNVSVLDVHVAGCRLRTKLIDGVFPSWRRILPEEGGAVVEVVISDLRRAMALAKATSNGRGRAVKIAGSDSALTVSCNSPDTGSVASKVPCAAATSLPDFGMNAAYLDDMARFMEALGSRTMRLAVTGAGNSIQIMPDPAITGTIAVVMPMRV